jgi:hypothetical protein
VAVPAGELRPQAEFSDAMMAYIEQGMGFTTALRCSLRDRAIELGQEVPS